MLQQLGFLPEYFIFGTFQKNLPNSIAMADVFEKLVKDGGPIGQHMKRAHGYFAFPKLEGELGSRMMFRGKEVICWSLNNYLGLVNHPETRKVDAEAGAKWGIGYPMGARMMSGKAQFRVVLTM